MGGRGSAFISYENSDSSSGVDIGILSDLIESLDEDLDTKLPHKGFTDKLKQKNIHIKESTDKISEEILLANVSKIDDMTNKYKRTTKLLKKTDEELRIRSHTLQNNVAAAFLSSPTDFERLQVVYNKDLQFMNKEQLENSTKEQIDKKYWTRSDDLVNHTISHEYGHYIQRILMERDIQKNKEDKERREKLIADIKKSASQQKAQHLINAYSEEFATRYIKSVQRVCRKNFGRDYEKIKLSDYGETSNREYFAEIFCNSETNTNPDDIGKAMQIYLKKKLK